MTRSISKWPSTCGQAGRPFASREIHQHALFKIFTDCCAENERTCDQCTFLALGERSGV